MNHHCAAARGSSSSLYKSRRTQSQQMVSVLYNNRYGGFQISAEAFAEYQRRGGTCEAEDDIARDDPIMVAVVKDMGARANHDKHANICIAMVPAPFEKHYRISEHDGLERVIVDVHRWFVDSVRAVLSGTLSADAKVQAIEALSATHAASCAA